MITPNSGFSGNLTVPVTVNDGESVSNSFNLVVTVIEAPNVAPQITGQSPLSVNENESLTIELSHLQVTDPDNTYPTGFTLQVLAGQKYRYNVIKVNPSAGFSGNLTVPVTMNDGESVSNSFNLTVTVIEAPNVAPQITGQSPLSVNENGSLTIELSHLQVTDPDNTYPTGFTLQVLAGQ